MPPGRPPPSPAQLRIHAAALQWFAENGTTRISVSQLAHAAGVARGTIYNNIEDCERLFNEVATQLVIEMEQHLEPLFDGSDDPAWLLAAGVLHYLRRAHEEPAWGRFLSRFGLSSSSLQALWTGSPLRVLQAGLANGRFAVREEQLVSVLGLVGGAALAAMLNVLDGQRGWRDAGADTVELVLVALGVVREEARALSRMELDRLPALAGRAPS